MLQDKLAISPRGAHAFEVHSAAFAQTIRVDMTADTVPYFIEYAADWMTFYADKVSVSLCAMHRRCAVFV